MKLLPLLCTLSVGLIPAILCAGCGGSSSPVATATGSTASAPSTPSTPALNPPNGFVATITANSKLTFSPPDVPPQIILFSTNIPGPVTWSAAPPTAATSTVLSAGTIDATTGIFTPARPVHLTNSQSQVSNVAVVSVNNPNVFAAVTVGMANY